MAGLFTYHLHAAPDDPAPLEFRLDDLAEVSARSLDVRHRLPNFSPNRPRAWKRTENSILYFKSALFAAGAPVLDVWMPDALLYGRHANDPARPAQVFNMRYIGAARPFEELAAYLRQYERGEADDAEFRVDPYLLDWNCQDATAESPLWLTAIVHDLEPAGPAGWRLRA